MELKVYHLKDHRVKSRNRMWYCMDRVSLMVDMNISLHWLDLDGWSRELDSYLREVLWELVYHRRGRSVVLTTMTGLILPDLQRVLTLRRWLNTNMSFHDEFAFLGTVAADSHATELQTYAALENGTTVIIQGVFPVESSLNKESIAYDGTIGAKTDFASQTEAWGR